MLGGVLDLVLAVHPPLPDRGHHLQLGRQSLRRNVEADLVVALAGAAVGDALGVLLAGHLHQHGRDQGAADGGGQRVFLLVDGAGLKGGPDEELQELLLAVDHIGGAGAYLEGALLDRVQVFLLTQVDGERDHVVALVLQPADGDRGVQAARIGENQLFALSQAAFSSGHQLRISP